MGPHDKFPSLTKPKGAHSHVLKHLHLGIFKECTVVMKMVQELKGVLLPAKQKPNFMEVIFN
jgi:hypothetical protein